MWRLEIVLSNNSLAHKSPNNIRTTQKYLIAIGGPTASGKTKLAILLAQHFNCEIINADSRQFYKHLDIGTAKPSAEELSMVAHHFINSLDLDQNYTAGQFEKDVEELLERLFEEKNIVIAVGGTGFYLKAITEGLDKIPASDAEHRSSYEALLAVKGIEVLQEELASRDPEYFNLVDKKNPHRLIRALSLMKTTGIKMSQFHGQKTSEKKFKTIKLYLTDDRQLLYDRIDRRVDEMMKSGLLEETKKHRAYANSQAMNTIGYKELMGYLNQEMSLEQAIVKIKQHSRNYAKRQLTWFRNQEAWQEFHASDLDAIVVFLKNSMDPGLIIPKHR